MAPGRSGGPSEEEPVPATTGQFPWLRSVLQVRPVSCRWLPRGVSLPSEAPCPTQSVWHAKPWFSWATSFPEPSSLHLGPLGRPLSPSCRA